MKRKKVLVIENFADDFEKSRMGYALYLIQNNYEVYTLIPETSKIKKDKRITYLHYDLNRSNKSLTQLIKLSYKINYYIKQYKIDIIHSFRFQPNIINVIANLFNNKIVITHITGLGISFSKKGYKYKCLRYLSIIIYNCIFLRANKIVTQNNADFRDLDKLNLFQSKSKVIYGSGVNTDFYSINNSMIKNIDINICKNKLKYLFISRLIYQKGIIDLIEAFDVAYKINNNIHLIIIGWIDNDNPNSIKKYEIDEYSKLPYITFLNKKSNIIDYYNYCDIFILPSKYREGIPRVLLEALSMSMPIITSNTPGCKLTVENNVNGILVSGGDVTGISNAILNIYKNNKILPKMMETSRNLAINKFSVKIIYRQFKELYN